MAEPRAVRISRAARAPGEDRRISFAVGWVPNRAAEVRAGRVFGLFVVGILTIYFLFIVIAETGAGVRAAPTAWIIFTLLAVALAGSGWAITFGRTPRGAQRREGDILVRERIGRVRRFAVEAAAAPKVLQRFDGGILGPEPTEVVEIATRERVYRTYIVGERYFESLAGR